MEDLFFDIWGKRHLPFAYFSARIFGLTLVFVSTAFWIVGGWDSTIESTFFGSGAYGYGIHWSTVQTAFLAFYLISADLQVGGFTSFRQLRGVLKRDAYAVLSHWACVVIYLAGDRKTASTAFRELRESYRDYSSVDPVRGFAFATLFALVAGLLFELIWVPLYDVTNFGSWFWPVYYFGNPLLGSPLLSSIFLRNNLMLALCAFFGATILYAAMDGEKGTLRPRFTVGWRFDTPWLYLVLAAVGFWGLWVFLPHTKVPESSVLANIPAINTNIHLNASVVASTQWVFPSQSLFPQTEYTFYPASAYLKAYPADQVFGFYLDHPVVHLVNVVTKYATFLAVCYPAMVKVRRREGP